MREGSLWTSGLRGIPAGFTGRNIAQVRAEPGMGRLLIAFIHPTFGAGVLFRLTIFNVSFQNGHPGRACSFRPGLTRRSCRRLEGSVELLCPSAVKRMSVSQRGHLVSFLHNSINNIPFNINIPPY